MHITLFGYIWIILIIVAFLSKDYKPFISLTLFSMIFQSNNVIVINSNVGVGPQIITSFLCLIKLYLFTPNNHLYNIYRIRKITLIFTVFIIHIIVSTYINIDDFGLLQVLNILMLIIYYACFGKFLSLEFKNKDEFVDKNIYMIAYFVIAIGIIQIMVVSGIIKGKEILRILFYNDTISDSVVYNVKTVNRLYSTFMEPSYAGAFLVGVFNYALVSEEVNRKNTVFLILVLVSIVLTKSTTAYVALLISILIWFLSKSNKKKIKVLLPIIIFIGLIVTIIFYDILQEVIFDKLSSISARVRSNWNKRALDTFKSNPYIGSGYKSQRASSLVYTILAELGIIGFLLYAFFIYKIIKPVFIKRASNDATYKGIFLVIGVLIAQIIACPDLNFSVFWFSMYIMALRSKNDYAINTS